MVATQIWWLVSLVPALAVTVRRLHDQDRTGFLALLYLIPILGAVIILVLLASAGTRGPNRFGPETARPSRSVPT